MLSLLDVFAFSCKNAESTHKGSFVRILQSAYFCCNINRLPK